MDRSYFNSSFTSQFGIYKRISIFKKNNFSKIGLFFVSKIKDRKWLGIFFSTLTLVSAIWADSVSSEIAIKNWQKNHQPKESLTHLLLGQIGMISINENENRYYKKISYSFSEEIYDSILNSNKIVQFWINQKWGCIAFSFHSLAIESNINKEWGVNYYCYSKKNIDEIFKNDKNFVLSDEVKLWREIGIGWVGLEEMIDEIEKIKIANRLNIQIKKIKKWIDPRKIDF